MTIDMNDVYCSQTYLAVVPHRFQAPPRLLSKEIAKLMMKNAPKNPQMDHQMRPPYTSLQIAGESEKATRESWEKLQSRIHSKNPEAISLTFSNIWPDYLSLTKRKNALKH